MQKENLDKVRPLIEKMERIKDSLHNLEKGYQQKELILGIARVSKFGGYIKGYGIPFSPDFSSVVYRIAKEYLLMEIKRVEDEIAVL